MIIQKIMKNKQIAQTTYRRQRLTKTNKKTTITFTKEVPAEGTIIKVERSNDKYLVFRNKGI